jgi:hypothetical protein
MMPAVILIAQMISSVGVMMGPGPGASSPPFDSSEILTEASESLTTESPSPLVTEAAP